MNIFSFGDRLKAINSASGGTFKSPYSSAMSGTPMLGWYESPEAPTPAAQAPSMPESQPDEASAPHAATGMHLFSDEQTAFDKMTAAGYSADDATAALKMRRADLLGNDTRLSDKEASALLKMQASGYDSSDAAEALKAFRSKEAGVKKDEYDSIPAWKKVGKSALDFAAGNLQTVLNYGGNVADVATLGKLGIGEEVKGMMEQNKETYGGNNSFAVGSYMPDVAMASAGGKYISGAKGLLSLMGRSAVVGGGFGAANELMTKGSDATLGGVAENAAISATVAGAIPALGKPVMWLAGKAKGAILKGLPEALQTSGSMAAKDFLNAAERISKLTWKEVEVSDATNWMLSHGIKWTIPEQRAMAQAVTDEAQQKVQSLLRSNSQDFSNSTIADKLKKGVKQVMEQFGTFDEKGRFMPSVGNEELTAAMQKLVDKPTMTLAEMNEARSLLAKQIFKPTGDMKLQNAMKGLQSVWRDASQFIDSKVPGFRAANKEAELGIAINDAMAKAEAAKAVKMLLSGIGAGAGLGWYAWYQKGGIEGGLEGAAVGALAIHGVQKLINLPQVKTAIAQFLYRLSPENRATILAVRKGLEVSGESLENAVTELAEVAPELRQGMAAAGSQAPGNVAGEVFSPSGATSTTAAPAGRRGVIVPEKGPTLMLPPGREPNVTPPNAGWISEYVGKWAPEMTAGPSGSRGIIVPEQKAPLLLPAGKTRLPTESLSELTKLEKQLAKDAGKGGKLWTPAYAESQLSEVRSKIAAVKAAINNPQTLQEAKLALAYYRTAPKIPYNLNKIEALKDMIAELAFK